MWIGRSRSTTRSNEGPGGTRTPRGPRWSLPRSRASHCSYTDGHTLGNAQAPDGAIAQLILLRRPNKEPDDEDSTRGLGVLFCYRGLTVGRTGRRRVYSYDACWRAWRSCRCSTVRQCRSAEGWIVSVAVTDGRRSQVTSDGNHRSRRAGGSNRTLA